MACDACPVEQPRYGRGISALSYARRTVSEIEGIHEGVDERVPVGWFGALGTIVVVVVEKSIREFLSTTLYYPVLTCD